MAERQPLTSEQRKEIAKRRREKAAAAALEPELAAIDEDSVPETKIGGTKPPKRKTGPSIADLNPMEEILINREEANKQLQEVESAHMKAAEERESLYERKLALERERHAEARTQLEDLQLYLQHAHGYVEKACHWKDPLVVFLVLEDIFSSIQYILEQCLLEVAS